MNHSFKTVLADGLRNIGQGLKTGPRRGLGVCLAAAAVFAVCAALIGQHGRLFEFDVLDLREAWFLPFTMLVFPSLLEEAFFRGLLIPRSTELKASRSSLTIILFSSLLFTLWHPFNALLINAGAREFFYNIHFLAIVFLLGITCAISYLASRSLWIPILIHWITILVWVFFLGGRNLAAQALH